MFTWTRFTKLTCMSTYYWRSKINLQAGTQTRYLIAVQQVRRGFFEYSSDRSSVLANIIVTLLSIFIAGSSNFIKRKSRNMIEWKYSKKMFVLKWLENFLKLKIFVKDCVTSENFECNDCNYTVFWLLIVEFNFKVFFLKLPYTLFWSGNNASYNDRYFHNFHVKREYNLLTYMLIWYTRVDFQ